MVGSTNLKFAAQLDRCDFKSECAHSSWSRSTLNCFQLVLVLKEPVSVLLVVTQAGRDGCKLPLTTEEDEEELQEATVSLAVVKEISVDAAVAAEEMAF